MKSFFRVLQCCIVLLCCLPGVGSVFATGTGGKQDGFPAPCTTPTLANNGPVCAGSTLALTANTNVTGATFSWTGPNGFTSTLQNPTIPDVTTAATGTYILTLTGGTCEAVSASTTVQINVIPSGLTASSNSPVCIGNTINLSAPFISNATYSWTGPNGFTSTQRSPSIANATAAHAGSYIVTISLAGCQAQSLTTVVAVNDSTPPIMLTNSPVCEGSSLILVAGINSNATYLWTGPNGYSSTTTINVLPNATANMTGTYTLLTTVPGCNPQLQNITVTVNPAPVITASSNSPVCNTGFLQLNSTAIAGANYVWTGPNSFTSTVINPSISNVSPANAGSYTVFVTAPGCPTASAVTEVVVNTFPTNLTLSSNSPVCAGSSIVLSAPFSAIATYSWGGPSAAIAGATGASATQTNATTAHAGVYSVTVSVAGCDPVMLTAPVSVSDLPNPVVLGSNSPLCTGSTLNLSAPFISGATYSWTGPNNFTSNVQNPAITNAQLNRSGTYTLTISNVPGCNTVTASVNVVVSAPPTSATLSSNSPVCAGSVLSLAATNITGATYTWAGASNSISTATTANATEANATANHSGTYSVTITTPGCTPVTLTTAVTVNTTPTNVTANSNSPVCVGTQLSLTATAVPGATYQWSGPANYSSTQQSPNIGNVAMTRNGIFTVAITVPGCAPVTASTNVVITNGPSITATNSGPVCEGGGIGLAVTNIVGATYEWSGPEGFTFTGTDTLLADVTAAQAGQYTVQVNAPGCNAITANTMVIINTLPVIETGSNGPICAGTTLQLTATTIAGATYTWEGPGIGAANVNAITPTIPEFNITGTLTYAVTVSLAGCTPVQGTVQVIVNPVSPITAWSNSPVCVGSNLQLTATALAGASYVWSGPNGFSAETRDTLLNNVTTEMAGTYIVTATVPGCNAQSSFVNVIINPIPVVSAGSDSPVCAGETLNLTATTIPGATYEWSGPGIGGENVNSITPTIPDFNISGNLNYVVTVTVPGCAPITTSTDVVAVPLPTVTASSNSPICRGNTLQLFTDSIPNATYTWSGIGINATNRHQQNPVLTNFTTPGTSTFTLTVVTTECQTPVTATTTIQVNNQPNVQVFNNGPLCEGETMLTYNITTIPGATYSWAGPNGFTSTSQNFLIENVNTTHTGFYSLTVTVGNCSNVPPATTLVLVKQTPVAPAVANNGPLCFGETLLLTSEPGPEGITYQWSGPNNFSSTLANPSIENVGSLNGGTYFFRIKKDGCLSQAITTNVQVGKLTSPVIGNNGPVCEGSTLNLTSVPLANVTYQWTGPNNYSSTLANPSITNVSPDQSGTYYLVATQNGCSSDAIPTQVAVFARPTAILNSGNTAICAGQTTTFGFTLTGKSPWTVFYSANGVTKTLQFESQLSPAAFSFEVSPMETTTYALAGVLDGNNCQTTLSESFVVTVHPLPTALFAGNGSSICRGETFDLGFKLTGKAPWKVSYTENNTLKSAIFGDESTVSPTTEILVVTPTASTVYQLISVSDANNCVTAESSSFELIVNDVPNATLLTQTQNICASAKASLTMQVTDVAASTPWVLRFTIGADIKQIEGVGPGNVSFETDTLSTETEVTLIAAFNADAPACIRALNQTGTIKVWNLPQVTATANESSCTTNGGSITAVATGGSESGYQFSLDGLNFNNTTGTITGLVAGNYTVTVRDANGCRATSEAVPVGDLPIPAMDSVSNIGINIATVSWTAILGSNYQIEYRPAGSGLDYLVKDVSNITTTTLFNLTGNTTYEVRVRSVCPLGTISGASDTLMFTTLPEPCVAPTNIKGTPVAGDNTKADISWTLAVTASCYELQYRRQNTASWTTVTVTDNQNPYRLVGLTPGQGYEVRMRTNCLTCPASGSMRSAYSAIQIFTQPSNSTVNCTLTAFSINNGATTVTGCGSVLLTPTLAENPNYLYQWRLNGVNISGATARTYTATTGGLYTLVVSEGDNCPPVTSASIAVSVSGVTFLLVTNVTNTTCTTCNDGVITATANTSSQDVLSFEYSLSGTVSRPFQTSNTFSGLPAGTYTVTARETGSGCIRQTTITVGVTQGLTAPVILAISGVQATRATVQWGAVSGAISYLIQYRVSGSSDWVNITNVTGTVRTITGLQAGTTYEVRMQAFGSSGAQSAFSAVSTFSTTAATGSCLAPTGIFVSTITTNSVRVHWSAVPGAACYDLEYRTGATWTVLSGASIQSPYTISGLGANQAYQIRMRTNCQTCTATGSNLSVYSATIGFATLASKEGDNVQTTVNESLQVSVYPNPNRGQFNVQLSGGTEDVPTQVRLLDINGRVVFEQTHPSITELTLSPELPAGLYLLEVKQNAIIRTTKVMIN